jgi:hypothetical protein
MSFSIVSSVIEYQLEQVDGRYNVRELHTDSYGIQYVFDYMADASINSQTHLSNNAAQLLTSLPLQEIAANIGAVESIGSLAIPTFNYSAVAQNITALRAAYLISTQVQAIMIGDYLSSLTNIQLETAFNLTAGQITTLRANYLTPAATAAASIRSAVGT